MKKNQNHKTFSIKYIALGLTGTISLIALGTSLYTIQRIQNIENDITGITTRIQAESARIRFCHDNQVVPCDDLSIDEWNAEHPDQIFNILQ